MEDRAGCTRAPQTGGRNDEVGPSRNLNQEISSAVPMIVEQFPINVGEVGEHLQDISTIQADNYDVGHGDFNLNQNLITDNPNVVPSLAAHVLELDQNTELAHENKVTCDEDAAQ